MKKQRTRELLLNTTVARKWEDSFDLNVDGLMDLISRTDTPEQATQVTEVLDVYSRKRKRAKPIKHKSEDMDERPFEFLVFIN